MAGKKTALTAEEKLARALVPQEEWPYELPKGWVWTYMGNIAEWGSGGTPSRKHPEYYGGDIPWVKTGELDDSYVYDTSEKITEEAISHSSAKIYPKDTVIIAMYGATIGKTGIMGVEAATNQACACAKVFSCVYFKYLFYYLISQKLCFIKSGKGGAQPNISQDFLKRFGIPLPPLPEQKRIVDKIQSLFARLDEARDKLQQVLEGTEARRAAILHEAFSGGWGTGDSEEGRVQSEEGAQEADGTVSVPEGWKKITLGDAYDLKAGKNIKAKEIYEKKDVHHPYPCYGGNGIRGYVQSFNREGLHPIIGRQGALCGNVNMADGEFYATEHAVVVTDKIPSNAVWTYYYLTYLNLNQYATSTAQPGLAVSNLNKIWIILPPLEVQQKVAEKLVSLYKKEDAAQKACESALAQIDLLKKAILARAFRGKLGTGDPNDPSALDLLKKSL